MAAATTLWWAWWALLICFLGLTACPCQAFLRGLDFPCDKPNGEEIEIPDSSRSPFDAVIMVNKGFNPDEDNPDGRIQINR